MLKFVNSLIKISYKVTYFTQIISTPKETVNQTLNTAHADKLHLQTSNKLHRIVVQLLRDVKSFTFFEIAHCINISYTFVVTAINSITTNRTNENA